MEKLNFYNVKTKSKFTTSNYNLIPKNTIRGIKYFAVTKNGGIDVYRVVSADFYRMNK